MKTAIKTKTKRRLDKPSERRRAPRRQPAIGTICRFGADSAIGAMGLVWNISTSGVSVLANHSCTAGTQLTGELKTLDDRASLPIQFHVAHVKELETGDYLIAGPFDRSLSAAKIRPFVALPKSRVKTS